MEIPVVFISSNAWAVAAGVALHSLVEHYNGSEKLKVYIFSQDMSEENEARFRSYSTENTEVNVVKVDASAWDQFSVKGYYVLPIVFLRYCLPRLLPQYDKILCLDIDILVQKDISELMNTDLEGKYAAGVLDMTAMETLKWHERLHLENYLNAGVLLLNAKRIRGECLEEKIFITRKEHPEYQCMDQDAFNVVCHDEVKCLSPIWNLMSYNLWINPYTICSMEQINNFYSSKYSTVADLEQAAAIIHLTNVFKPWEFEDAYMADTWMKTFRESKFSDISLNLKRIPRAAVYSEDDEIVHVIKRVGPFVKDWTEKLTVLQFLGIPLIKKVKGPGYIYVKIGPMPVVKREQIQCKERITFLGLFTKEMRRHGKLDDAGTVEQQLDRLDQMRRDHDKV